MFKNTFKKSKINERRNILAEAILESEDGSIARLVPKKFKTHFISLLNNRKIFIGGSALVIASFLANVLNYVFNAFLSRILSFGDFALIGLIGGFLSLASILFGAYAFTFNYSSSFLIGRFGDSAAYKFWQVLSKRSIYPSFIVAGIWLLLTPLLMNFFHTTNVYLFILFSLVLLFGFINSINQGFLSSKLLFGSLAVLSLIDPLIKLFATYELTSMGLKNWTFATIILSFMIVTFTGWLLIAKQVRKETVNAAISSIDSLPKNIFFLSLLSGFSSVAYFTFDIFLAKHFLTATEAGQYALVSLVGKMIFFLGNLTSPFITPFVSRYEGARKNSLHALYIIIAIATLFTFIGFILFGVFGYITIPILYGEKARVIVPYVLLFTFGMACYSISSVFVNYYLVKKVYSFTLATSLLVILQVGLITLFHDSVKSIAMVMSFVLMANLLVILILHFCANKVKTFEKSFATFFRLSVKSKRYHEFSYVYNSIQRIVMKGNK